MWGVDRPRVVGVTARACRVTDLLHTGRTTPERVVSHPEFRFELPSFTERARAWAFKIFRQSKPSLVHPVTHIPKIRQASDALVKVERLTCRQDITNASSLPLSSALGPGHLEAAET